MYKEKEEITYENLITWDKNKLVIFSLSLNEELKKLKPKNLINKGYGCLG
ncbi:MAG: hypothetical protein P8M03_04520 [Flavobacteriaceae bacterium]|jgi:hypothetical protein|nr:hypothetical protein [Flavobacteriaceae bacterium]